MSNTKKKNRCRDCVHFVLGYTSTTQEEPSQVCDYTEKRIYRADLIGVRGRVYHFSARPYHYCEHFERRNENS